MLVERFSIGFGPRLWGFTRGGTEYRISLVPLGGYVKLTGGDQPGEEKSIGDDPRLFLNKPPGVRGAVFAAGVVMNFALGVVLFALAFRMGYPVGLPEIGGVEPGSPAELAGLRKGDIVLTINNKTDVDGDVLQRAQLLSKPGKRVSLTVQRPGETAPVDIEIVPTKRPEYPYPIWGILPAASMTVGAVTSDSRMAAEGLVQPRDTILSARGKAIDDWGELVELMRSAPGGEIPVQVERDGRTVSTTLTVGTYKEYDLGMESSSGAIVKDVPSGLPASEAKLVKGDEILSVGDAAIHSWTQLRDILNASDGQSLTLEVRRADQSFEIPVTPVAQNVELQSVPDQAVRYILGVTPVFSPVVGKVRAGSPAWEAGLRPDDVLVAVEARRSDGGKPLSTRYDVEDFHQFVLAVDSYLNNGRTVTAHWERDGERMQGEIRPGEATTLARIDLLPRPPEKDVYRRGLAPLRFALRNSISFVTVIAKSIWWIANGWINWKRSVAGPIGIVQISYQMAREGLLYAVYFFGLINVNLAILNLLPIPILDGGHILFIIIEKVRGKRVNEKTMMVAQYVGLTIILALVAFVLYADILRILR